MNMKKLVHIRFLYLLKQNIQFILIVLGVEHIPKEINKFIRNEIKGI